MWMLYVYNRIQNDAGYIQPLRNIPPLLLPRLLCMVYYCTPVGGRRVPVEGRQRPTESKEKN